MPKNPSIKPYIVKNSNRSVADVFREVNKAMYQGYCSDYTISSGLERIVVNSLFHYKLFLSRLKELPHIEFVTHRDLLKEDYPHNSVRVSIRHDVDGDIVAAVKQAEIEAGLNIPTSWYLLHTAPYYGSFKNNIFHRNECMGHYYLHLQNLGHEVGLHTDPLKIYQHLKIDGAQAIVEELRWLRGLGLNINGTVAHNSKETYGAFNYEIFKGKTQRFDAECTRLHETDSNNKEIFHKGTWSPLQVLDMNELKLDYEGNDVFRRTRLEYGATRALDRWRWNAQIRRIKNRENQLDTYFIDHERLLEDVKQIQTGTSVVFVVHPLYYGSRHNDFQSPPLRLNKLDVSVSPELGWVTYKPDTFQCWSNRLSVEQEYQAINKTNMFGMLDKPLFEDTDQANVVRLLLLGSDNIDGRQIGISSQIQSCLEELLCAVSCNTVKVHKLAFPNMGISRLWSWYERTRDIIRPHIVLMGINSQAIRQNVPLIWSKELGFSIHHPPGDYLGWDSQSNAIQIVRASKGWAVRQRKSVRMVNFPGCDCSLDEIMADTHGFNFNGVNCFDFLTECYRFMCDQIKQDNATPIIFVEESGEAAGFFCEKIDEKSHRDFISSLNQRFASVASTVGVALVNPYDRFEICSNGLPTHFQYDKAWNQTGHRLAAESIFLHLRTKKMFQVQTEKVIHRNQSN
ncbi:hypothetical protein ACFL5Z_07090 [Planctomycetota bacterium]